MRIFLLLVISSLLNLVNVQNAFAQNVRIEKAVKESYNGSDVSCANLNNGQITVSASGGSGFYEYSKNNGVSYENSNILTGLKGEANTIIRVRDANNHKNVSEALYVWIADVKPVVLNVLRRDTHYNNGDDGISCAGKSDGRIVAEAYGGTAPYTFSIDGGVTFQSGSTFKNLAAGIYSGIVKDANGCIAYSSVKAILVEPKPITVNVLGLTNATCSKPYGSITIKGEGSTGDYQFSIDGGAFFWVGTNDKYTFSELSLGRHRIVIKDNNYGCPGEFNFEITSSVSATLSANGTTCQGENVDLVINIKNMANGQVREVFTATYKDNKKNIFIKTGLGYGDNIISIGQLAVSTTFKLISVKSNAGCAAFVADAESYINVDHPGNWLGKSEDWHDPKNWTCGQVPTATLDVKINATKNDPVIARLFGEVHSLYNTTEAKITVKSKLSISGELEENNSLDASEGTLEFIGESQNINGRMFTNRTIHNLIVSTKTELRVGEEYGDTLNITGNLTFGSKRSVLRTGDNITLKSTINGTANIGVVGKENVIEGNFIVERYINTGIDKSLGQHGKAWMLLATPTIGSSIYESWQESGNTTGKTPIDNNHKGFGTLLTTGYNKVVENGFDLYTAPGSSIKTYNFKSGSYDQGPKTTYDQIYNERGYLVMVRGDRSVFTSNSAANPVVLRTKGEIITGTTKAIEVAGDHWESIGNPYASRIYINKIQRTGGVDEFISVWDPKLGGTYGLGAFQTLFSIGENYYAMPGGGSYGKEPVTFIESGQAFFVQATKKDGTVYFTEDSKTPSLRKNMERGGGTASAISSLRSSLYALGAGEAILADGNILLAGNFSNDIDGRDARKMVNSAENFSILSSGQLLTVESRQQITSDDTLFFNMTGMRAQNYLLEFIAEDLGMPGMQAWLVDAFTGTRTPLNLNNTTKVEFTVSNQPRAAASNRFMIVFRPAMVLPVTFLDVKATLNNANVLVEWTVEAESNLKHYEVERSLDGNTFSKTATVSADKTNGGRYQWLDQNPATGNNYYRIRSLDLDGKTSLTQIVKVQIESSPGSISVYPNPISNGVLNLQLGNQPEGVYNLRLLNPVGQVLQTKKINHAGGNHTEKINWDHSLPRGMYTLEISNTQTGVKIIKVMY